MNIQEHSILSANIYQDEISISDIVVKLWKRRGLLVVVPIIFFLLAVIYLTFSAVTTNAPTVYFVELHGIEKSAYPNGASFNPQDLLLPDVLQQAVTSLGLKVDEKFRDAVQVEYGVPTTEGIQKKYQEKLNTKNLTTAEIDQINAEYKQELRSATQSGLRISIDYSALGLSAEQGAVLANALPRAWVEVFVKKYRVLIDTSLDNVSIVGNERKNLLQKTSDVLRARNALQRIRQGVQILNNDSRLKTVTSQSGFNSSDILSKLQYFEDLFFRPIFSTVFSNPDHAAASFMLEAHLQMNELDSNIAELDRSLSDIKGLRIKAAGVMDAEGRVDGLQVGENTLNQIISLADRASLSDYLKKILTDRRDLVEQKAKLQLELERANAKMTLPSEESFLPAAQSEYNTLITEYISLLSAARKTRQQLYGDFFEPFGTPEVIKASLPPKTLSIVALSILLGAFFAMLLALALPYREK